MSAVDIMFGVRLALLFAACVTLFIFRVEMRRFLTAQLWHSSNADRLAAAFWLLSVGTINANIVHMLGAVLGADLVLRFVPATVWITAGLVVMILAHFIGACAWVSALSRTPFRVVALRFGALLASIGIIGATLSWVYLGGG
jgi:hypothetical protein